MHIRGFGNAYSRVCGNLLKGLGSLLEGLEKPITGFGEAY
jgi:hypothetical protein